MITSLFDLAKRFYQDRGILGRVIAIDVLLKEASDESRRLTERHDVPQGEHVPEDLRDRAPRYITTRDGFSIASLLHPNDKTIGSDSAAIGLAQAMLFLLGAGAGTIVALFGLLMSILPVDELKGLVGLMAVLVIIASSAVALLPAFSLFQAEKSAFISFAFLFAIPLVAFASVGLGAATGTGPFWGPGVYLFQAVWAGLSQAAGSNGNQLAISIALVTGGAIITLPAMLLGLKALAPKTFKRARSTFVEQLTGVLGAILMLFAVFLMPLWVMVPIPVALSAGLFIWAHAASNRKARAQDLLLNTMQYSGLDLGMRAALSRHEGARREQAENAAKDLSPFVKLGVAKGVLSQQMDGYAPDAGLPFGLTVKDLSTHALVLGPTGSGKTSGVLRPLIKAIHGARGGVDLADWSFDEASNPYSIATRLRSELSRGRHVWLVADRAESAKSSAVRIDPRVEYLGYPEAERRIAEVADATTIAVMDDALFSKLRASAKSNPNILVIEARTSSPLFGMLIMDGKGALADEARGISDLVIEPGVELGLIEGLRIEDLVEAVASVAGATSAKVGEGSGGSEFFNSAAREALRHATALYFAMCEQEVRFIANGWVSDPSGKAPQRDWVRTWAGLTMVTQEILKCGRDAGGALSVSPFIETIIRSVSGGGNGERQHPELGKRGLLDQAITYARGVPKNDERTLANISATLEQWMSPIMSHSELLPWTTQETGKDPSIVLRGGIVGINVPIFKYGIAGKIVQNLIRLRINSEIRRRSDYPWETFGETPVILLIDEAQEVITESDGAMIAVARSLGGWYVCATQNADSFQAKFGESRANAVMDQFRSLIGIGMMSPDSKALMQERFGNGAILAWMGEVSALNFGAIAQRYASMPFQDRDHPLRPELRTYLRQGAALWRNELEQGSKSVGEEDTPASSMSIDDHDRHGTHFRMSSRHMHSATIKYEAIYNPAIIDSYLARPKHAIAQVLRGGVIRRDVIELNPVHRF